MRSNLQAQPERPSLARRAVAGLVVLAIVALAIHFVIGLIMAMFWVVVAIVAVVGVLWALNTLL